MGRDKEACLRDEGSAQESLTKTWSQYSATHKAQCLGMNTRGGPPSYVELISCLEVMKGAIAIDKSDGGL
jgi:hypothetical protein